MEGPVPQIGMTVLLTVTCMTFLLFAYAIKWLRVVPQGKDSTSLPLVTPDHQRLTELKVPASLRLTDADEVVQVTFPSSPPASLQAYAVGPFSKKPLLQRDRSFTIPSDTLLQAINGTGATRIEWVHTNEWGGKTLAITSLH